VYKCGNTVHQSARFDRSFLLFCLFVFVVVCLVLLSLVAAAFLENKDVGLGLGLGLYNSLPRLHDAAASVELHAIIFLYIWQIN